MRLKTNINLQEFFKALNYCSGEVYYDTKEGDHLNLKSQFSQLVLSVLYNQEYSHLSGIITLQIDSDYSVLSKFIYE